MAALDINDYAVKLEKEAMRRELKIYKKDS
jgi:hypothetical protein